MLDSGVCTRPDGQGGALRGMRVRQHYGVGGVVPEEIIVAECWVEASRTSRLELRIPAQSLLQLSILRGRVSGSRPPGTLAKPGCLGEHCGQGCSRSVLLFTLIYARPHAPLSSSPFLSYSCSSFSGEPAGLFLPHVLSL